MRLLLHSPIGLLLAEYDVESVHALRFWRTDEHPPAGTRDAAARGDALGRRLMDELAQYFAGERRDFSWPLRPSATPFQAAVREQLRRIPFGEVRSYGEIAAALGRRGAARAIGQANARNPFPVVVPCHRVVAAGGRLGGYMGEGGEGAALGIKRWLLGHEGRSWEIEVGS